MTGRIRQAPSASAGPTGERTVQVRPIRIHLLDEPDLPIPAPLFQRLLALDRLDDAVVGFVPDEPRHAVGRGEAGAVPAPMLVDPAGQVVGDADIQRVNRAGFSGGPNSCEDGAMTKRTPPFSPEVRERAVRMVLEHQGDHASQYGAIRSIAAKIGCSGETLRNWVRQAERDQGVRAGPTTDERERIKALERENRELRQANEILKKASAYFAQAELDRPFKR